MKACNRKILELFYSAKHTGRIVKPDAVGRVGDNDDGLVIEITWRVINGIIEDAKFRAFGNPNAIAITSLMVDNVIGKSVEDAMLINENVIIDNLGEFRPEYLEAFDMVHLCLEEANTNYLKRHNRKDYIDRVEDYEHQVPRHEEIEIDVEKQIQTELQGKAPSTTKGRGRPKKEVDESLVVEVGEKRGRGRPKKIVDESEVVEAGEKRGRGRPKKLVETTDETEQMTTEKRGRGRPKKVVDESLVVEVGEKRGRGRPKKIVDESELVEVGEKRSRGRPKKLVETTDETEQITTEKRGRGRPKKVVDESLVVEVGEKRGRGRPKKIVDESELVEVGEKRSRGRPKKDIKYNFPSDLDEVINDKDVHELINGVSRTEQETSTFVDNLISNKIMEEDDFDENYDLFKSNIRNILSGKQVNSVVNANEEYDKVTKAEEISQHVNDEYTTYNAEPQQVNAKLDIEDIKNDAVEQDIEKVEESVEGVETVKRGRGRPRKTIDETEVEAEVGEKRGRGRPKKIVIEAVEENETEKRGRGRPRRDAVSSLTRSLISTGGVPAYNNTQDIVFASKNVTTTNININVTKTTTNDENNQTINDYSKNVSISSVQENSTISTPAKVVEYNEEIDMEKDGLEIDNNTNKSYDEIDDIEDEIDASYIKDEAPKGGIEDLLKALLSDE